MTDRDVLYVVNPYNSYQLIPFVASSYSIKYEVIVEPPVNVPVKADIITYI